MTEQAKLSSLLHRAISCAHGLTNYVESRPGLTAIERELAAIEAEFKALRAIEASERPALEKDDPEWAEHLRALRVREKSVQSERVRPLATLGKK